MITVFGYVCGSKDRSLVVHTSVLSTLQTKRNNKSIVFWRNSTIIVKY